MPSSVLYFVFVFDLFYIEVTSTDKTYKEGFIKLGYNTFGNKYNDFSWKQSFHKFSNKSIKPNMDKKGAGLNESLVGLTFLLLFCLEGNMTQLPM